MFLRVLKKDKEQEFINLDYVLKVTKQETSEEVIYTFMLVNKEMAYAKFNINEDKRINAFEDKLKLQLVSDEEEKEALRQRKNDAVQTLKRN